jgi:hypothetical protein
MKRCYLYLRTSADDRDKAGIPVEREGCKKYAARATPTPVFSVPRATKPVSKQSLPLARTNTTPKL